MSSSNHSSRRRRERTVVLVGAALLVSAAVAVVGPGERAVGAASSAAAAEECEPIGPETTLTGSCQVALEPTPLPQRRVVGEYELGLLSRTSVPTTTVAEFGAGGVQGSCDPATEVCSTTAELGLLDDPRDPGSAEPTVRVPDDGFGAAAGDGAVTAVDLDGDGRQELVRAARCAATTDLCLSLFTPGDRSPGSAGYSEPFATGLRIDPGSVGRIRLASGPVSLASTTVVAARFAVDRDQETTTATFTTEARHGFGVGIRCAWATSPRCRRRCASRRRCPPAGSSAWARTCCPTGRSPR